MKKNPFSYSCLERERVSFREVPTKFWPDNYFFVSLRIMLKLGYTHVDCNSDGNKNIIPVFEIAK